MPTFHLQSGPDRQLFFLARGANGCDVPYYVLTIGARVRPSVG